MDPSSTTHYCVNVQYCVLLRFPLAPISFGSISILFCHFTTTIQSLDDFVSTTTASVRPVFTWEASIKGGYWLAGKFNYIKNSSSFEGLLKAFLIGTQHFDVGRFDAGGTGQFTQYNFAA